MKNKKILLSILFAIIMLFVIQNKAQASLNLNNLDFDVQINEDGSMDVTEKWDIHISETNTLFKTFKKDSSKYSSITDVEVKEITNGSNKSFTKINKEMYHVTKDCYYALNNSNGMFEIAWGVGLDDDSATRKYLISYKVNDAIAIYNDYAELYWQFIGDEFEIPANHVKGTILLPQKAESKEDIRVWGHTEDLNGTIYATSSNKIEFEINNYRGGKYVEVRSLFPTYIVQNSERTYNKNIYNEVISEETKWADDANARRARRENSFKIIAGIIFLVSIIFIIKIFKNIKKLKNMPKRIKPTTQLEYFRELPYEDATAAEALFIMSNGYDTSFASSFSANVMNLTLKKFLTLEVIEKKTSFSSGNVKIIILEKDENELKRDEKVTLDLLKQVARFSKKENELTTKDITKYFKKYPSKVSSLDKSIKYIVEDFETQKENFIKENKTKKEQYQGICVCYIMGIVFTFVASSITLAENFTAIFTNKILSIPFALVMLSLLINSILTGMMAHRLSILTQKGVDEKEQWKSFKKYMEDFSLLKEKEVPDLVLWEKYLVFATAFGISEKVLKQLKVVYPEINDMNSSMYYSFAYIHIMNSVDIGSCINSSVYSAVSSSGGGAGGGFSGGGGGGRRPEVAAEVAKP